MACPKKSTSPKDSSANLGFEAKLWLAADKLRNNMDASEYIRSRTGRILRPMNRLAKRDSFSEVLLLGRLREAILRLNPTVSFCIHSSLRDTLLAELLSGELSVADAEEVVHHLEKQTV